MRFTRIGALAVVAVMAVGACSQTGAPSASTGASGGGGGGTLKLGVSLPLSGGAAADGQPTLKGAQLAVDQANEAGGIGGYTIELLPLDHAVNGRYNEQQAAADMQTFASDPAVFGVVGPYNSAAARAQIPISNDAGLLQCSPANTAEGLTKPEFGALDLRKNFPDRINYIRVATTDDVQGPAMASYAYNQLELRNVLVIDDVTTFGTGVADNFQAEFEELGGTVADRVGAPADTTDFNGIITEAQTQDPDGVYYGGVVTSGAGLLLKQMRQQGMDVPFLGPDGIVNGNGNAEGSLIQIAGTDAADNSYGTIAAIGDFPAKAEFSEEFEAHFANDADFKTPGAYSGPAHACATIVLESLRAFLEGNAGADQAAIREGVRAYATDSENEFETVLGPTSFDENGDNKAKFISFYEVDPAAENNGDWIFIEQQDFGGEG
jgi:branched-chain amino acid transport system substrate-binding protein